MPLSQPFAPWEPTKPPTARGVYELGRPAPTETGYAVVYIGSGIVRDRLRAHAQTKDHWSVYRCEVTNSTRRARQRERAEQRQFRDQTGRLPFYNDRIG